MDTQTLSQFRTYLKSRTRRRSHFSDADLHAILEEAGKPEESKGREEFSIEWSPTYFSLASVLLAPLQAVGKAYKRLLRRLKKEPDKEIPLELSEIDKYMIGTWMPVTSSNVTAIRYLPEDKELEIEFHGGRPDEPAFYRYQNVSPVEARSFANAPSYGKWVWDNLRVRGTVYGFKKPYVFISGPSTYQPKWMDNQYTRRVHGAITGVKAMKFATGDWRRAFFFAAAPAQALATSQWVHEPTAKSQHRWRSLKTGRIVYQLNAPGEHEHAGPSAETATAPAPAAPPKENPDIHKPKNSLGVPRHEMPQIPGKHVKEFLSKLAADGVQFKEGKVQVHRLKPTQGELSKTQMNALLKKLPPDKLGAKIIVSKDGYILDGHHRWGALYHQDPNSLIHVVQVGLPIKDLLAKAKAFDKTVYKDVGATGAGLPPLASLPPLPEPTSKEQMLKEWLPKALDHPYIKEAQRRLDEMRNTESDTEVKYDKRPDGSWDAERVEKVHKPIIEHFVNKKAAAKSGERPKAVFLIGPFGAGKSTAGEPVVKKFMPEYTLVNPDEIKQKMPEDEGWNATLIHEESSHLSKQIAAQAKAERHHLLFDGSGQNSKKMSQQVDDLTAQGYDVHVVHVTVPSYVSTHRAATRFLENPFGMGGEKYKKKKPSRYAPLDYVARDVDSKPDETYQTLKKNPNVKSGKSFSTHGVKLGDPVPMVDSFDRASEAKPGKPGEPAKPAAGPAAK